jgi:hypothetical protein
MMEVARTSETSVDIQLRTRQYIPEDSELQDFVLTHLHLLISNDSSIIFYPFKVQ